MVYVALLRGINVGGANKVDMKVLKETFEAAGMRDVRTYINSGNVVFSSPIRTPKRLAGLLEAAIAERFGFDVKVLVRDVDTIRTTVAALDPGWKNDQTQKCDVMFLWDDFDRPDVLDGLTIKPEIDMVRYVAGAIVWRVDRTHVTRSGMMKLVGTPLYKKMTIRNCNTVRKLLELMEST